MKHATALADARREQVLAEAEERMRRELGDELRRLKTLREVNPSIRAEEIAHLEYLIEECAAHISHASLQMEALRLVVTT
jgi:ATP-dependent helicase HepA